MDLSGQTLRGHHGHTGGKLRNYFAKDFRADQLGVHGRDSRRYHTVLLDAKIRMLIKKGASHCGGCPAEIQADGKVS
ncbi:MAG: hypothetical protein PVS2B2_06460 [Candidatus Acidiferrum sp.]